MSKAFLDILLDDLLSDTSGTFFDMLDSVEETIDLLGGLENYEAIDQWKLVIDGEVAVGDVSGVPSLVSDNRPQKADVDHLPPVDMTEPPVYSVPETDDTIDERMSIVSDDVAKTPQSDTAHDKRVHGDKETVFLPARDRQSAPWASSLSPAETNIPGPHAETKVQHRTQVDFDDEDGFLEYSVPVSQKWKVLAYKDDEVIDSSVIIVQLTVPYDSEKAQVLPEDYPDDSQWLNAALEQGAWLLKKYGEPAFKGREDGQDKSVRFDYSSSAKNAKRVARENANSSSTRALVLSYVESLPSTESSSQWTGSTVHALIESGASSARVDIQNRFANRFLTITNTLRKKLDVPALSLGDEASSDAVDNMFDIELYHDATPELLADVAFKKYVVGSARHQRMLLDSTSRGILPVVTIHHIDRQHGEDYFSSYVKSLYKFSVSL